MESLFTLTQVKVGNSLFNNNFLITNSFQKLYSLANNKQEFTVGVTRNPNAKFTTYITTLNHTVTIYNQPFAVFIIGIPLSFTQIY